MKKTTLIVFFTTFFLVNCIFIAGKLAQLQKMRSLQETIAKKEHIPTPLENEQILPSRRQIQTTAQENNEIKNNDFVPQIPLNLNVRVLGIIHGEKSVAFIERTLEKSNGIFLEGDIINNAKIVEIQKDRVIFQIQGNKQMLKIDNPGFQSNEEFSIKKITPFERAIDRQSLFKNVIKIAQEANNLKITSALNNKKKIAGLKVMNIPQQGIIKELGLEDNDIIKRVNGFDIKSIPNAIKVYKKIRKNPDIEVEVIRNNSPLILKYQMFDFK